MPKYEIELTEEEDDKLSEIMRFHKYDLKRFFLTAMEEFYVPPHPVDQNAYAHMLQFISIILEQTRQNTPNILREKSLLTLHEHFSAMDKMDVVVVIANGPSLTDKQLKLISHSRFQERGGVVFCVDSALNKVLRFGIIPDAVVCVDRQRETAELINYPLIRELGTGLNWIVPMDIHPETRDYMRGERWWFKPWFPENPTRNLNFYLRFLYPQLPIVNLGGNVGSSAVFIAYSLLFKTIAMVGMDYSWSGKMKPHETENFLVDVIQHGGRIKYNRRNKFEGVIWPCDTEACLDDRLFNGECAARRKDDPDFKLCQEEFDSQFKYVKDPWGDVRLINQTYSIYRDVMLDHARQIKKRDPDVRFINCTGGGLLFDDEEDNIKLQDLKEFLETVWEEGKDEPQEGA